MKTPAGHDQISRNNDLSDNVSSNVKLASTVSFFVRGLITAVLFSALVTFAETTSFTSNLTEENKTSTGVAKLTPEQLTALDAQIRREVSVARQGDTPAFSTPFTRRRTPQQRKVAGLDQLMTPELNRLDELVALAVATPPTPTGPLITKPFVSTPPGDDWVEVTPRRLNVHGEVTLAYMWGSGGRSGYGASMATTVSDPSNRFALTFVLSQFRFKGSHGCYPYPYSLYDGRYW